MERGPCRSRETRRRGLCPARPSHAERNLARKPRRPVARWSFWTKENTRGDRGTTFTSAFWSTLCYYLVVKRCVSTAFHPQTDGQTERVNQTLECYLRCYVDYQQDDWLSLLPSAEYACNSHVNASTGKVPF